MRLQLTSRQNAVAARRVANSNWRRDAMERALYIEPNVNHRRPSRCASAGLPIVKRRCRFGGDRTVFSRMMDGWNAHTKTPTGARPIARRQAASWPA